MYSWLLLPCTDCRTKLECKRYFDDLISFLTEPSTVRAIGTDGVMAVRTLARSLYTNRAKCCAYQRMHLKDVVSAMTTSPVEGHISMTGKTGVSARTHLDESVKTIVSRAERNLDTRKSDDHRELASVNMSSRSPTNACLIWPGEALVCRYHGDRV